MYTIYHIEGVKIGCSINPKKRVKAQGYGAFQVLEVHEDIQIASKREIELQLEYGYGRDNKPYDKTISMPTPEGRSKAGKIAGQKNVESGHWKTLHSKGGKIGGKIGGKRNVESGHWASLKTTEHQIKAGKIGGKTTCAIERTCPWCFRTIKGPSYFRCHGDRCKFAW